MGEVESLPSGAGDDDLWHVTLTVAGNGVPPLEVKSAIERLSQEHPFLLSGRYASDRAEVRYWEEAKTVTIALQLAARLWDEHYDSARLPAWRVVGVEIVDRETFHLRGNEAHLPGVLVGSGAVLPF